MRDIAVAVLKLNAFRRQKTRRPAGAALRGLAAGQRQESVPRLDYGMAARPEALRQGLLFLRRPASEPVEAENY